MHIKKISRPRPADLRHNLEVILLMLDVVHSAIAIITKQPFGGHDDHDDHDDHGHTH